MRVDRLSYDILIGSQAGVVSELGIERKGVGVHLPDVFHTPPIVRIAVEVAPVFGEPVLHPPGEESHVGTDSGFGHYQLSERILFSLSKSSSRRKMIFEPSFNTTSATTLCCAEVIMSLRSL